MSPPSKPNSNSSFLQSLVLADFIVPVPTIVGSGKSWTVSLTGTSGDDVFDPGTGIGASTMTGGGGNDVFYVHSGSDKVVVPPNAGASTIILAGPFATYDLQANVTNLVAEAPGAMNLVGNGLANIIRANNSGDTLQGGGGADTLVGGQGRDSFVVSQGGGSDTIVDFQAGANADTVSLRGYGFTSFNALQAAMHQSGAGAVLALGNGETLTFTNHAVADFVAANSVCRRRRRVRRAVRRRPQAAAAAVAARVRRRRPPAPPTRPRCRMRPAARRWSG